MNRRLREHFELSDEWRAVLAQPISDDAKEAACLSVLQNYIERNARSHVRRANPQLHLYTDMMLLMEYLRGGKSDLDRAMLFAVDDWIKKHQSNSAVTEVTDN